MLKKRKYTDPELVAGCIINDRRCQEHLYRTYVQRMMMMCLRHTRDEQAALEIVNDGFLRVFKKIHLYSFKGSLEGWIRRLVYNSLSEYYKKHSKYLQFLVFEERDSSFEPNALQNMFVEDIMKLIEKLPPATKSVFRLSAIEGHTHVEIAKQLRISVGTSKWHLATARKKLKVLLEHYNSDHISTYAG